MRWTRVVDAALLGLLVVVTATGGLAFAVGAAPASGVVVAVHGAAGLGLLLLAPAKVRIARRGLRRPGRSRAAAGLVLAVAVLLAVASGLLHAVGGFRSYLGLLPMQVHVGSAVVVVVLLVAHGWAHHGPRWARHGPGRGRRPLLRRTDLDRRVALRGAAIGAGAAALWVLAPGRDRRETGSHPVGSGEPALMPVTQWLFDPVPRLPADRWRLRVPGRELDLPQLTALGQRTVPAVLDCTGGWYAEQEWRGVPLSELRLPPAASLEVVSVTGYRRRFPAGEAGSLLLATHVAGRPLSAGHGGPARLVAPGRRGFWWVKWVAAVEVVDEPWWWQPPFPLQ